MPAHLHQPEPSPVLAPDVIRVPEINQPETTDFPVDCPTEMPARETI